MMKPHAEAEPLKLRFKIRPQGWIYASAAILIVVLALADLGLVLKLRENAMRATEHALANSSRTLAEEADRAFQSVDLVLNGLSDRLTSAGVEDGASYRRLMASYATHLMLEEKLGALPQLDAITMIDADGKLINFSRYWPIPDVNVADRDYFRALQRDAKVRSFVSAPVQNRGDGSWTIYLAHRIDGPDGAFAGLVLGAMRMKYFEDFYHSVLPGATSAISMVRDDGVLLARYPTSDAIGVSFPDAGGQSALKGASDGTTRAVSPVDGQMRIKAAAHLAHYPIVILSTMTQAEALEDWSSAALTLSLITAGCAIAITFAALAIGRWSKQQQVLARTTEERAAAENARIAAEAQLMREREQSAAAASRAKSTFLATMSHEIRTPMNAVLGLTDILLDGSLDPEKHKVVATIRESGDILLRLLNDILDYSKLEAGRISFENLAFSPEALGHNILSILGPRAAAKGLALTYDVDPDLPSAVLGDAGRVRQVLMNLVSNALKFTPAGTIAIATRCLQRADEIAIIEWCVSDTGIGIPRDKIDRLFTEFSQADSSITRRFGGTGLGLAISRQLVDQMGGKIAVESSEGSGTTLRFQLPLPIVATPVETRVAHGDNESRLRLALQRLGRPLRLLVAEDNPTNQFVLIRQLRGLDIDVSIANDGVEAVEAASTGNPDLIFMDMQMPEMDGIEATRAIRNRGGRLATVPIVALTANAFQEDAEACRKAGMAKFLSKPVSRTQLMHTILTAAFPEGMRGAPADTDHGPIPVFDETTLKTLSDELGIEVVREMIDLFLGDTEMQLERLKELSSPDDLLRTVHNLKGSARSAGAVALAAAASGAEARLRAQGGAGLPEREKLFEAFAAYRTLVASWQRAAAEVI